MEEKKKKFEGKEDREDFVEEKKKRVDIDGIYKDVVMLHQAGQSIHDIEVRFSKQYEGEVSFYQQKGDLLTMSYQGKVYHYPERI